MEEPTNNAEPILSRPGETEKGTYKASHQMAHKNDLLFHPIFYILSEMQIKLLTTPVAGTLLSVESIISTIQQNTDWEATWANQILNVVRPYDNQILEAERQKELKKTQKVLRARTKQTMDENQAPALQNFI